MHCLVPWSQQNCFLPVWQVQIVHCQGKKVQKFILVNTGDCDVMNDVWNTFSRDCGPLQWQNHHLPVCKWMFLVLPLGTATSWSTQHPPSSGNQKHLIKIQADCDRLSPFHDKTPCQEHLLRAPSRVLELIHTHAGFYSLIVAHAMFYRTEAFLASDGYFEDLAALECFLQKH